MAFFFFSYGKGMELAPWEVDRTGGRGHSWESLGYQAVVVCTGESLPLCAQWAGIRQGCNNRRSHGTTPTPTPPCLTLHNLTQR